MRPVNALDGFGSRYDTAVQSQHHLGLIIAGGAAGRILTSPDGVTWTSRSGVFGATAWEGSAYSFERARFVASGDLGKIAHTSDGESWALGAGASQWVQGVAWSAELGLFVAVTGSGATSGLRFKSPDGIAWSSAGAGGLPLYSIAWSRARGKFVAVGQNGRVVSTSDGLAWTEQTACGLTQALAVLYSDALGGFFASGSGGSAVRFNSSGSGAWASLPVSNMGAYISALCANESDAVLVIGGASGAVGKSVDGGATWLYSGSLSGIITEIVFAPWVSLYVAVTTSGHIYTSPNALSWTHRHAAGGALYGLGLS